MVLLSLSAGSPLARAEDWHFDEFGNLLVKSDLHIQSFDDGSFRNSYFFNEWLSDTRTLAGQIEASSKTRFVDKDTLLVDGDEPASSRLWSIKSNDYLTPDIAAAGAYLPVVGCCLVAKESDWDMRIVDIGSGREIGPVASSVPRETLLRDYLYNSFTSVDFRPMVRCFWQIRRGTERVSGDCMTQRRLRMFMGPSTGLFRAAVTLLRFQRTGRPLK